MSTNGEPIDPTGAAFGAATAPEEADAAGCSIRRPIVTGIAVTRPAPIAVPGSP
ncbi:hypothetical protein ACFVSU_05025 [Microbacterium sp. NPDC058062]|uniref:hypothetical protein n=1 Tax=Microbacterium sp. NPDC058062 TaxID=3346320 RepID=UPI0036DFA178